MIVGLGQVDIGPNPTAEQVSSDVAQWVGNIDPTAMLLIGAGIFVLYHLSTTGSRKSVRVRAIRTPVKVRRPRAKKPRAAYKQLMRGPRAGEFVKV